MDLHKTKQDQRAKDKKKNEWEKQELQIGQKQTEHGEVEDKIKPT